MYKIRVSKAPKPGDQKDYALIGRGMNYVGEGQANNTVKNTMGAVPREEANVEVEGGETVVGDVNQDGFLEHMTFVGKRHSQGGIPVNLPEGSFIFSDTKKLRIKDKEVLSKVFGLTPKKGGYTPAEIAKRYQVNQFIQDLKDPDIDAIRKRSSNEMLKKNMEKLGMLALVQESMKGFPDGVPAIAESAAAGLQAMMPQEQAQPEPAPQEEPQMRMGGRLPKAQDGKNMAGFPMVPGASFYVGNQKVKIKKIDDNWFDEDFVHLDKPVNGVSKIPLKDFKKYFNTDQQYRLKGASSATGASPTGAPDYASLANSGNKYYNYTPIVFGSAPQRDASTANALSVGQIGSLKYEDLFVIGNNQYEVVNPMVTNDKGESFVQVRNLNNNSTTYISANELRTNARKNQFARIDPRTGEIIIPGTQAPASAPAANNAAQQADNTFGSSMVRERTPAPAPAAPRKAPSQPAAPAKSRTGAPAPAPAPAPASRKSSGSFNSAQDVLNSFREGGSLFKMQPGGPQPVLTSQVQNEEELKQRTNQRVNPNAEVFMGEVTLADGTVVQKFYRGKDKIVKNKATGEVLASAPRTDSQAYEQYGSQNINQILAQNPNVRYTNTNFGSFGHQPNVRGSGIYLSSANAAARKSGDLSAEEWQDFQDRHGDWIEQEYTSPSGTGFAAFQKDLRAGKTTGNKAADWFQNKVNEYSRNEYGVDYFGAKSSKNPYTKDSLFGQVTYSVPRFFKLEKPKEPQPLQAFYCVEYSDGTKNVVSVSYKEGEQPAAPSGGNITKVDGPHPDNGTAAGRCVGSDMSVIEKDKVRKDTPWWLQDTVNMRGAITDEINRYEPTQTKVDVQTPGYTLLDPTRQLAANQEQQARFQQQAENTVDGNIGLASTLGASGAGFQNAANVLSSVENQNVGIVNAAAANNAQIRNNAAAINEQGRQKYVEDMATLNQQYDNARQQKKWREIAAFNNGTTNYFRKKQMEQVLFPDTYINPMTGDVSIDPSGRNIFGPDTYSPSYAGGAGSMGTAMTQMNNMAMTAYDQTYNDAKGKFPEKDARDMAMIAYRNAMTAAKPSASRRDNYFNMATNGQMMPQDMTPGYGFGGMVFPWDDDND